MKFKKQFKKLEDFENGDVPFGEFFEYNRIEIRCVQYYHEGCNKCYFFKYCDNKIKSPAECISYSRKDSKSVMFIKI